MPPSRFTAQSPAPLALIPIEDMLGLAEQPNLPGTIDEHPNWRRRLATCAGIGDARMRPQARARLKHLARGARMTPRATMRLQFHKGFTFADAERLVPYLARLGISHVYASPITTARAGLDARLRRDRSDARQSGARRRGGVEALRRDAARRPASG